MVVEMNNKDLFNYMKSSHDSTIAELQKSEQRIVDTFADYELRVRSLEDSRMAAKWIIRTVSKIAIAVPAMGVVLIKSWKYLQKHGLIQ